MPLFLIASRVFRNLGRYRVGALVGLALTIVVVGGILFSLTQHISLGLGLYWSVTTATTVGYGDVIPHNTAGRIVAAGVMLTTIPIVGAVFALVAGAAVISRVRRLLGMETRLLPESFTAVYGTHPVLSHVLQELSHSGDPVLLIAPQQPVDLPDSFHFIAGDPTDEAIIRKSRPERANRALIACESEADTLVVAVAIHATAPDLVVYALTQSPRVAQALSDLGITHTLAANELVAHTLAKSLEAPQAGDALLQLIDTTSYRLVEAPVAEELVSQRLSDARGRSGTLVLGLCRSGTVELGIGEDPVLCAGDQLLMLERLTR
jgi:voltage-gated potassium channel